MGRGSSGTVRRGGGGGGLDPADIANQRDLVSMRERNRSEVDSVLEAARGIYDGYGGETVGQFFVSDIKGKSGASVLAYSDGDNIGFNSRYFNSAAMDGAYDECIRSGFHPARGGKTAMEAVAAHEFGHVLTERVAQRMGITGSNSIHTAATRIVNEARPKTSHRGVVQMASKISGYATHSNAEAIAEAVSDVYCNGSRASAESRAIVSVVRSYLNP